MDDKQKTVLTALLAILSIFLLAITSGEEKKTISETESYHNVKSLP